VRTALIKGQSRYGLLRCFVDDVAQGLLARGDEAVVLDLTQFALEDLGTRLKALGPVDLVFSFNICSDYRDAKGRTIFEITGAPHVTHFVDHPLHHLDRLNATPRDAAVLFVDRSHVRAIPKLFGPDRFAYAGFCPHGALGEPAPVPTDAAQFCAERPIEALFAGTYYLPDASLLDQFPDHVKALFGAAIEAASAADWLPALDALDQALAAFGMNPDDAGLSREEREGIAALRNLAYIIDDRVRVGRRLRLLEEAAAAGLPLTLVGENYGGDLVRRPNVGYRGPVRTDEISLLMRQSRMVLNANANFGDGSHERPLTAMLAGAAAASDFSTFYDDEFDNGAEIILFRWSKLGADLEAIKALLADPEVLFEVAQAGQEAVAARHRWRHRIDTYYAAARAAHRA
jgi:hypothetical protein